MRGVKNQLLRFTYTAMRCNVDASSFTCDCLNTILSLTTVLERISKPFISPMSTCH